MSRAAAVYIWLPALVGAAAFVPRALPVAPRAAAIVPHAVELPALHGAPIAREPQRYELAAEASSVRFRVVGAHDQLLVACTHATGSLTLDPRDGSGTLELTLDLGALTPVADGPRDFDARTVLGVFGGVPLHYRAQLVATASSDLPGVGGTTWLGTLHFGARALHQPMQLWICRLPGRPLRACGHGTMPAAAFGLERRWFPWFARHRDVTLGLDLCWRRTRGQ